MDTTKYRYICLVLLVACVQAKRTYLFTSPKTVRPGRVYTIEGSLFEIPRAPVTLVAKLMDGSKEITATEIVVTGTESAQLDLNVPTDLAKSSSYRVTIEGIGAGMNFKKENRVTYEEKSTSVYIQTDKAVYKPGQAVRFRVFGVTPELQIIFDKLHVELYDPKGNKIKQWHISGKEMGDLGGVYIQQQQLSEFPVLGIWKLKAKLLSYGSTYEEQTFEVKEYVLPRFEVELDLPSFGRTTDTNFEGKVTAKYTFGKPVKGEVSLRIKPQNQRVSRALTEIEMQFPIDGTASFTIKTSKLSDLVNSLDQKTLMFEANVTESITRAKQKDTQGVTFYRVPYKVEFPKSLPNTFKPGMQYNAVVKVVKRDDTPLDHTSSRLKVTVTEYTHTTDIWRPMPQQRFWWRPLPTPRETSKKLPPTFHDIPADGIVEIPIEAGSKPFKLSVKAEYEGASDSLTLKKRHSPSKSYLQLTQKTLSSKAGERTTFEIRRTEAASTVNYQVFSKGKIVDAGAISLTGTSTNWDLMMTSAMAPKSRVLIYYIRDDGEVVADALSINVEGVFANKVSVNFNDTSAMPANGIRLDIKADTGSRVNVLGVDKSVLMMGTSNDISKAEVIQELQSFDTKVARKPGSPGFPICDWFCWRWSMPVGGEDVKDVFDDSGILVFTDANVYEHREVIEQPWDFWEPVLPVFDFQVRRTPAMPGMNMMAANGMGAGMMVEKTALGPAVDLSGMIDRMKQADLSPPSPDELAPVQRKRELFPETWLWTDTTIPSSGVATIEETVPDTITSWIATAFAIHPSSGLGISEQSANLKVSMPFFISAILPYSVVRGEEVVIQVNIHNYSPENLFVYVELGKSTEFDNIQITETSQTTTSVDETRTITVASESVGAVYFPIVPRKLGRIDLNIKAQTKLMADAIKKQLLVEAEGTQREYNLPFVIDLRERGSVAKTLKVDYPKSTVSGSQRVKATVIGDLMGPSIQGLDKLLKMPYGCGEQNMLKFAPNIFVMKYLEATKNLDEATQTKAKEFLETGYQRELTYAHSDGSYSAFGERDSSGSLWLTAFVLKSFVQAKPFTFIDDDVINKAVDWLIDQQNTDGTFREPGRVIHKAMQGGSTSGKVSMTAYVLISLLEAKSISGVASKISDSQQKAQAYLEGQVAGLTDVYDLAIVSYALSLAGSSDAATAMGALESKAIVEDGKKHWERNPQKPSTTKKAWSKQTGKAVDIELTSYALLAMAHKKDRLEGAKVLKWLTEQRNQHGGFASTQDTVIALQALSEMAALLHSKQYDLTVDITGSGLSETFKVNNNNALVLQSREVPYDVGTVTITANGQGLALAQLEVVYNIAEDSQKESFRLTVELPRETVNDFDIKVCASWLEKGASSMALLEIGSPSGFYPDTATLVTEPGHKREEVESQKLVLYFDEIGRADTCAYITMQRVAMVSGAQPVPVRVLDYYDPRKSVTEFYIPASLRDAQVCDVCVDCEFCVPIKSGVQ